MTSIKDIMTKNVTTASADKTVFEAAELMKTKKISCLVIVQGEAPIGIITERDIVWRVVAQKLPHNTSISEIMTKNPIMVDPDISLKDAARLMSAKRIRRLPVLKERKLVGIVVASDFVRNAGKTTISEEILDAFTRYPGVPGLI